MNVVNGLAALFVAVEHGTVTCLATQLLCQFLRGVDHMANDGAILFGDVVQRGDMLLRDHQKVHWGLRVDIVKGEDLIIFVYLLGRNLAVDDLAEQTIRAVLLGWLRVRSVTALPAV